jgi:hypothetical protein
VQVRGQNLPRALKSITKKYSNIEHLDFKGD